MNRLSTPHETAAADQAALRNEGPEHADILPPDAVAGRISAATLAAAHKVLRYHADTRAARALQQRHAELGADQISFSSR